VTSSTRSAAVVPWRIATIAAVALLAVAAGAVAGAFLVSNERTGLGSGAAYVPSGAPVYVEVRVIPSDAQDAALREFLGHFPPIDGLDLGQPLSDQLVEHLDDMLAAEGADLTWTDDVATWFDGRMAMALLELDPAGSPLVGEVPSTVAFLGVTDRAAADAAIDRIIAASGETASSEFVHDGVTIAVLGGGEMGAWALTDDQLIFGSSETAVVAALDAHANAGETLAADAERASLGAALPSDWLAFVSYDMTGLMAQTLDLMPDPASADALRALMEQQPMRGAMAVSASGDRIGMDAVSDAPSGAFAVENADRGLTDEVPGDALYYAEASNIGASLAGVVGPMKEALAGMPEAADQVDQLEAALGADLEELVSWIGDGAFAAGMNGSEPYAGLVLVPDDRDAAERRLEQLAAFAELGAGEAGIGVTVEEAEVSGTQVTTLCWRDPDAIDLELAIATEVCVEWALTDDRVLVGFGEGFVARSLGLDAGDSLAAQAGFSAAVASMGGASNAGMAWIDLDGLTSAVTDLLGSAPEAQMFASPLAEAMAWLDPLDSIVSVSRLEGDLLVQRAALIVE
jgi:hypothetical protein